MTEQPSKLRSTSIVLIACICGWFMMQLEILGVRLLTPYFGSSVYVVTGSVIGVFLLSLSIGYMLGGWLCGKTNPRKTLGVFIIIIGAWLIAIPFFTEAVCEAIFNLTVGDNLILDEKWGSLLASLVLFGAPTILFGTVSPTALHWLTNQNSNTGFNAGMVLAASTVSSFAGCVVTAFYLVLFSMKLTLTLSGIIMAILGAAILLTPRIIKYSNSR